MEAGRGSYILLKFGKGTEWDWVWLMMYRLVRRVRSSKGRAGMDGEWRAINREHDQTGLMKPGNVSPGAQSVLRLIRCLGTCSDLGLYAPRLLLFLNHQEVLGHLNLIPVTNSVRLSSGRVE